MISMIRRRSDSAYSSLEKKAMLLSATDLNLGRGTMSEYIKIHFKLFYNTLKGQSHEKVGKMRVLLGDSLGTN
jgi:hypothetical protein